MTVDRPGRRLAGLGVVLGAVVAAAAGAVVPAGAAGSTADPSPTPSVSTPSATAPPTPSAPASPTESPGAATARPGAGDCWAYGFRAAVAATGTVPTQEPVPCRGRRTALTVAVGDLAAYADGHLLALDARPVQSQAASDCRAAFADAVGGTARTRTLSLLRPVWTLPTFEAYLDGAAWARCDVVMLGGDSRLAPLPGGLRGILDGSSVPPRRVGRCSTGTPGAAGAQEVPCTERHRWRAVATVSVADGAARPDTPYPGRRAVAARARSACERVAQRSQGTVRFRFSAQFPSAADWREDRRQGTCWLPD